VWGHSTVGLVLQRDDKFIIALKISRSVHGRAIKSTGERRSVSIRRLLTAECLTLTIWRHCCHMGTAAEHPVPDRVKPSFVIFDIRALWRSVLSVSTLTLCWASECPDVKNYKWRLNQVWHSMLYSCTHMATVGVKGLTTAMEALHIVSIDHNWRH